MQFSVLAVSKRILSPNIAFSLSFLTATVTHYFLNRFWALPSYRRDNWRQLIEYIATAGFSYFLNLGLFILCRRMFDFGVMVSAILAVPPSTLVVFLILNYWVFSHRHTPSTSVSGA